VAEGTIDLDAKVAKYLGKKDWFGRLPNASSLSVRSFGSRLTIRYLVRIP
jgi:CubicO group peptidase (beta-lactamase class C family)